jgi:transitional endoplasmic reticulum ATPase
MIDLSMLRPILYDTFCRIASDNEISQTEISMTIPRHRRKSRGSMSTVDITPAVRLWLLRLLIPLGGHREFIGRHGFSNDTVAQMLGLGEWIDPVDRDFDPKVVRAELRKLHQTGERELRDAATPSCFASNVVRLSKLVGLSDTDCRVLEFAVLIHNERLLDDASDWLGQLSSVKVFHALSILLDLPEHEIRSALSTSGILTKSGLVSVNRSGMSTLRGKLDLLSGDFADHILSFDADPASLLRDTVALGSPAQLEIADYGHIAPSLSVLRPYLRNALVTCRKGVNVFLHGDPGTGKSQLAKVLAKELGCELFEVASEDGDGDPVNGERRLRAFRAAQSFFSQRRSIIVFDEAEDVFNDGDSFLGRKSTAQTRKAWINRMLEENSVPAFWLSNSISGLDPAFVRRFDMVLELPVPPKRQRVRIIEQSCSDLLDASSMARLAESESLAPAVITRAASVVRLIRDELGEAGASSAMELLIDNTLEAQGHKPLRRNGHNWLPEIYDPSFIHADADLAQVAIGLVQSKSGRLCLYGPPGTGKTAYGRWLADQMGIPLMVKRASDLMSKWVGENEKNIASAFKQAEQDGALLLIDEVDSFLQDRRGAQRGWEVSLVNEMLTQMESFPGVFIASTNLMEGLDQAALRRFDLKVKFDFLKPEQAGELLGRYCSMLDLSAPQPDQIAKLKHLQKLTPGDFAAVIRQNRFRPITSANALVSALGAECAVKEGARAAIGFFQ